MCHLLGLWLHEPWDVGLLLCVVVESGQGQMQESEALPLDPAVLQGPQF